ncbi:hypothetical protein [Gymnodinialimonas sp. 57CJ19]|uniref:hypothetical protein n=1 Tax=Gymnodinialimonas sp. 57CJ19 TaxID=3138498 RepID=UPI0031343E3C
MGWTKLGKIYCPDGTQSWAQHSFMTPVPVQMSSEVIRLYGGMRDGSGVSRIGWIDVDSADPKNVLRVCQSPALDVGAPGMFDDNGVILGDVIRVSDNKLRMYYVGFQLVEKAKFLAFTGVAESHSRFESFERLQPTPILDRAPQAPFINALHSIERSSQGYRAWISCGQQWQMIDGTAYPQYNCWTVTSRDGVIFDMRQSVKILDVTGSEYRIGRPRAHRLHDGTYELRVTSDTWERRYSSNLARSEDGIHFVRTQIDELPRGPIGSWDSDMTCYPARIDTWSGLSFIFYNGNGMGRTGVGVAVLDE